MQLVSILKDDFEDLKIVENGILESAYIKRWCLLRKWYIVEKYVYENEERSF